MEACNNPVNAEASFHSSLMCNPGVCSVCMNRWCVATVQSNPIQAFLLRHLVVDQWVAHYKVMTNDDDNKNNNNVDRAAVCAVCNSVQANF